MISVPPKWDNHTVEVNASSSKWFLYSVEASLAQQAKSAPEGQSEQNLRCHQLDFSQTVIGQVNPA